MFAIIYLLVIPIFHLGFGFVSAGSPSRPYMNNIPGGGENLSSSPCARFARACGIIGCMKHILPAILVLLSTVRLSAQETIHISGFKCSTDARSEMVSDFDGRPCAVLRMETAQGGWSFDAGLVGIVDVVTGKDAVEVYVPASARSITVAREGCRPLREWPFPERLVPGMTYSMKLAAKAPQPVYTAPKAVRPAPATPVRPQPAIASPYGYRESYTGRSATPQSGSHVKDDHLGWDTGQALGFSKSFVDAYAGFAQNMEYDFLEETFVGLRYTRLENRVGPYFSAAISDDGCGAFFGGAALRLFREDRSSVDFQLYGGLGLVYGCCLGLEGGIRFAWKSESRVSHWDFGFGCQMWSGYVAPTVEVGLCIWGIPLIICLGFAAASL